MSKKNFILLFTLYISMLLSCNDSAVSPENIDRDFMMGFTSWPFGPSVLDVNSTYDYIDMHSDIYAEHIDNRIPWDAWMNNLPLPSAFTNEISGKVNRRLENKQLLLSVGLLNLSRDDLAMDLDGSVPEYEELNDLSIEEAYFKHLQYLVNNFNPDYLVVAIEVNELRLNAPDKWQAYKLLMNNVTNRLRLAFPGLSISESVSLHNLYEPTIDNPNSYIQDIAERMNQQDFVAISYYPFLKDQSTPTEFQETLDFLHDLVDLPIAFVETAHIAEDLIVPNFNLNISGTPQGQLQYLETLISNARISDYEFIIWWTHRDFDTLWETFPDELKDLGRLWRDTGLLDESGIQRPAKLLWDSTLED